MQDPLRQIAEEIVQAKGDIDPELKDKMTDELVAAMERQINGEMVSRLDHDQLEEFNAFLDTNPNEEQTLAFFSDRNINVTEAVTVALARFKDAYVG